MALTEPVHVNCPTQIKGTSAYSILMVLPARTNERKTERKEKKKERKKEGKKELSDEYLFSVFPPLFLSRDTNNFSSNIDFHYPVFVLTPPPLFFSHTHANMNKHTHMYCRRTEQCLSLTAAFQSSAVTQTVW